MVVAACGDGAAHLMVARKQRKEKHRLTSQSPLQVHGPASYRPHPLPVVPQSGGQAYNIPAFKIRTFKVLTVALLLICIIVVLLESSKPIKNTSCLFLK